MNISQVGGGGLTSIDPFCYVKTSHNRGLNNSELNFRICLSFSSVAKVQMYRVYYRIVFKRLRWLFYQVAGMLFFGIDFYVIV